jgi:filamentous hemagglutinin family protein
MNKNRFRRVFSKRLGMLVAVAEDVVSQGKTPGEGAASGAASDEGALGVVSAMTAFAVAILATQPGVSFAQALPTGGQVTAGQASISQGSNTMTINQGTQRTVIDWNSFNIGSGNTVQFNQPNAQSQALNRVTGGGASNIQGSLLANGQVLIQNANGVLFGKGAIVNVGSLLATTKSIDANQFMAGGPLQLSSTGTNASVVNDGTIQAQGFVTLMGDQVRNSGSITTAQGGQVVLAAGDSATVALPNGQGIQLTLTNATANALVENSGKHQDYASYMKVIAGCDMFLNPFPFGNTNGIVDTVWAGLVGVCKTGREVHEHIDEGMFRRLGFPEWTIAGTTQDYKAAALRLIENESERRDLARTLAGKKAIEKLIFKGRPEILGERIQALLKNLHGAQARVAVTEAK